MNEKQNNVRESAGRILRNVEELIADISSWNDNRPDARPLDLEDVRVLRAKLVEAIDRYDAGDRDPHLFRDVVAYAEKSLDE